MPRRDAGALKARADRVAVADADRVDVADVVRRRRARADRQSLRQAVLDRPAPPAARCVPGVEMRQLHAERRALDAVHAVVEAVPDVVVLAFLPPVAQRAQIRRRARRRWW